MKTMLLLSPLVVGLVVSLTSSDAATSQYYTYSLHTDSRCTSVPKQIAYVHRPDPSTGACASSCIADNTTGLFLASACVADPNARSVSLFGSTPWLQFEIYKPNTACTALASVIAYAAEGACLTVDNGSSSVRAFVFANKSAAIMRYDGAACSGSPTKTNKLDSDKLGRGRCIDGLLLASTGNATVESSMASSHALSVKATPPSVMGATLLGVAAMTVRMIEL